MYCTLPSDSIRNFIVPSKNPNPHVSMAITIVPDEVALQGYLAEQFSIIRIHQLSKQLKKIQTQLNIKWLDRIIDRYDDGSEIVCRTLLQSNVSYVDYVNKVNPNLSPKQTQLLESLPQYVWVTEVSLPNLYSANKHKLGEIVIRANATEQELTSGKAFIWAWLPGIVQLTNPSDLEIWNINTHVPLIRNIEGPVSEW